MKPERERSLLKRQEVQDALRRVAGKLGRRTYSRPLLKKDASLLQEYCRLPVDLVAWIAYLRPSLEGTKVEALQDMIRTTQDLALLEAARAFACSAMRASETHGSEDLDAPDVPKPPAWPSFVKFRVPGKNQWRAVPRELLKEWVVRALPFTPEERPFRSVGFAMEFGLLTTAGQMYHRAVVAAARSDLRKLLRHAKQIDDIVYRIEDRESKSYMGPGADIGPGAQGGRPMTWSKASCSQLIRELEEWTPSNLAKLFSELGVKDLANADTVKLLKDDLAKRERRKMRKKDKARQDRAPEK